MISYRSHILLWTYLTIVILYRWKSVIVFCDFRMFFFFLLHQRTEMIGQQIIRCPFEHGNLECDVSAVRWITRTPILKSNTHNICTSLKCWWTQYSGLSVGRKRIQQKWTVLQTSTLAILVQAVRNKVYYSTTWYFLHEVLTVCIYKKTVTYKKPFIVVRSNKKKIRDSI